jgi:hypothetical protein
MKDKRERIGLFPSFRQAGGKLVARIANHQAVEHQRVDAFRLRIDADTWVEIGGAYINEKDKRVAPMMTAATGAQQRAERQQQRKNSTHT